MNNLDILLLDVLTDLIKEYGKKNKVGAYSLLTKRFFFIYGKNPQNLKQSLFIGYRANDSYSFPLAVIDFDNTGVIKVMDQDEIKQDMGIFYQEIL